MTIESAPLAADPEMREDLQRSLLKFAEGVLSRREATAIADVAIHGISTILPYELICIALINDRGVQILGIQGSIDSRLDPGVEMSSAEWRRIAKTALDDEVVYWSSADLVREGYGSPTLSSTPHMAYVSFPSTMTIKLLGI